MHHISLCHGLRQLLFSNRRTVSRLTGPIPACAFAACSSNTIVQHLTPAGGPEHASAEILTSKSVPYFRDFPGRSASRSAYSTPPSRYADRARQMTLRPTPRTAMMWASGMARSCAQKNVRSIDLACVVQVYRPISFDQLAVFVGKAQFCWSHSHCPGRGDLGGR